MDDFKEIQDLIEQDKVKNTDKFLYAKILQKIQSFEETKLFVPNIKKLHIICSIAAGLLFGILMGKIVQYHIKEDKRIVQMENVLNNCYLNEMKYEYIEFQMLDN